jgi:E1A/CREB-binding protein
LVSVQAHAQDDTRHMSAEAREKERKERQVHAQRTMQLLVHACSCNSSACTSNSCRKVRQLFQHAVQCQQKVTGGCHYCRRMWCLLNLHAKHCTKADCNVPRCKYVPCVGTGLGCAYRLCACVCVCA